MLKKYRPFEKFYQVAGSRELGKKIDKKKNEHSERYTENNSWRKLG